MWDPRRQPGAWGGAAAGSLARILAGVCARAGQTRIGDTGGSYPDRERARSNPHRGHGRVKSETGKDGTKKKKPTWGCWFLPAAFNWGFNQGFYWAAKHVGVYLEFYVGLPALDFNLEQVVVEGATMSWGGLLFRDPMLSWMNVVKYTTRNKFLDFGGLNRKIDDSMARKPIGLLLDYFFVTYTTLTIARDPRR